MTTSQTAGKFHIAASGAKQGQWVRCSAQDCRLQNTSHVTSLQLKDTQTWLKEEKGVKKSMATVSTDDLTAYKKAVVEGYDPQKAAQIRFAEKLKALQPAVQAAVRPSILKESERAAQQPAPQRKRVFTTPPGRLTVKTTDFDAIRTYAAELNVEVAGNFTNHRSGLFGIGGDKFIHSSNVRFRGGEEQVNKVIKYAKRLVKTSDLSIWTW